MGVISQQSCQWWHHLHSQWIMTIPNILESTIVRLFSSFLGMSQPCLSTLEGILQYQKISHDIIYYGILKYPIIFYNVYIYYIIYDILYIYVYYITVFPLPVAGLLALFCEGHQHGFSKLIVFLESVGRGSACGCLPTTVGRYPLVN